MRTHVQRSARGINRDVLFSLLVAIPIWFAFAPMLGNGFVWDDVLALVQNDRWRGLSWDHIRWMFSTRFMGPYQPLTWLSHALVHSLVGLEPKAFLFVNLLLHSINTALFFLVLRAYLGRIPSCRPSGSAVTFSLGCLVGALFFGLHPLRVESVAWITERRDVLAGLFYFATLLAYERMVTSRDAGSRGWGWQTACLAFFTLSLLAKAWAMMLPLVFVLLDVFPLRRVSVSRVLTRDSVPLLLEKLPFIVLAGGAALLALMGQREAAMGMVGDHGVVDRIVQAGYGSLFYVWKTVWPFGLSPLYILPDDFNPFGIHRLAPAALSGLLTVGLVVAARKWTWAAIVWLSYLIIVAPVLGFAQSGQQLAADRYTYFPCLPFAAVVAAGWLHSVQRVPRYLAPVVIGTSLVLICLGSLTFRQTGFWRDEASLWARALEVDPHNYVALYNQGVVRSERGDLDGARGDLDSALRENPLYARAWFSRGNVRRDVGDVAGALADYAEALRLEPSMSQAYVNRANVLSHQGDLTGALADYNQALRLKPNNAKAYLNRAALRSRLGDDAGALADYEICLRLKPDWAVVYFNRGNHHLLHGRLKEAESQFGEAIRIEPSFSDYWYNRASVRQRLGDTAGMTSDLVEALRYAPDDWPQRPQVVKALGRKTGTGKAGTGVTR